MLNPTIENESGEPKLRSDARRNREMLIQVAEQLLRETAGNLRIEELADRAGVGMGTIYRNLGDKDQIIETVIRLCNERALHALLQVPLDVDAWDSFEAAAHVIVTSSFGNLWNPQLIAMVDRTSPDVHDLIVAITGRMDAIVVRAQTEGRLRTDIDSREILELLTRIVREIIPGGRSDDEMRDTVHRMLRVVLDGLRFIP